MTASMSPRRCCRRGLRGKPVQTTIDYNSQLAANAAVAQASGSAALVAVQGGTGKILAVASHQAAGMPNLDPLAGQYEPGQAFTMISAAMFLANGLNPDTILPCPASNSVNGHNFYNQPAEPHLRQSTRFARDFALGCSTALAGASQKMSAANLVKTADEFGIGARWSLPLASGGYFVGTIGQPTSEVGLAAGHDRPGRCPGQPAGHGAGGRHRRVRQVGRSGAGDRGAGPEDDSPGHHEPAGAVSSCSSSCAKRWRTAAGPRPTPETRCTGRPGLRRSDHTASCLSAGLSVIRELPLLQ